MTLWDIGPALCAQDTIDTLGELTIEGLSMHIDGAWNVLNPQVLWTPVEYKGQNRRKPRAQGSRANPRRIAQGTYSLDMLIDGRWDVPAAAVAVSPWIGLQHNVRYLQSTVVNPPIAPTATRPATLVMPDGDVLAGPVQCGPLIHQGTETSVFTAVLTVIVPGGVLAESGS